MCSIGAGLITRLDIDTPTAQWVVFLMIAGIGSGTAMQLPYTALQIDLRFVLLRLSLSILTDFATAKQMCQSATVSPYTSARFVY